MCLYVHLYLQSLPGDLAPMDKLKLLCKGV